MTKLVKKLINSKIQLLLLIFTMLSVTLNAYLITFGNNNATIEYDGDYDHTQELLECEENVKYQPANPSAEADKNEQMIKSFSITKTNNLSKILQADGFNKDQIKRILAAIQKIYPLNKISDGDKLIIEDIDTGNKKELENVLMKKIYILTDTSRIELAFNKDITDYDAKHIILPLENKVKLVSSKVNNSIFVSARKAGADSRVVMELINLFSYSVDFQRDIKSGDKFKVLYEQQHNNSGKVVSKPKILYASITAKGEVKEIFRHALTSGKIDYFDSKGESVRKALLKTPINGAKMTSGFGFRKHPVLGYSRMHKGLDYGAPVGTPVLAAGDGVVQTINNQPSGYGRHIQLKHNGTYSTLYAHLSRFAANIKQGSKISQGQVIGYVGKSGLSTGPHLHYEVIQAGNKVNPNKASFPKMPPLKGPEFKKFQQLIASTGQVVASLESKNNASVMQAQAGHKSSH